MKALISGSIAYDTIMVFEDEFRNRIFPDQVHILNVCFVAPSMRREFGGCAGNIAYNLKLLGGDPRILATVGDDFDSYSYQLEKHSLDDQFIKHIPGSFTAQAFITTDLENNQITAFHPGAMNFAHESDFNSAVQQVQLGIVAPNGKQGMLDHASSFVKKGVPFFFDPGQQMPMFSKEELLNFIDQASYVIVNDYESKMLQDKTGMTEQEIAAKLEAYVITMGSKGATIFHSGNVIQIPAAPISEAVDPTGCGDAFRGGMLFGILKGLGWQECGQIGSLCGAIKIEHGGTQNHSFTLEEFVNRYEQSFGQKLSL